jgi:hypothetical protein
MLVQKIFNDSCIMATIKWNINGEFVFHDRDMAYFQSQL